METSTKKIDEPTRKKPARLVLTILVLFLCYVIHWFPFNFIATFIKFPLWSALAVIAVLAVLRLLLPNYYPKAYPIAGGVYYAAVGAYACLLGFFVWMLDASFLAIATLCVLVLLGALLKLSDRRLPFVLMGIAMLAYIWTFPFLVAKVMMFFAAAIIVVALTFIPPKQLGRTALFFAAMIGLLCLRLGSFYYGADEALVAKVMARKNIESVISIDRPKDRAWRLLGDQIRYAADNMAGTHTIIGSNGSTVAIDSGGNVKSILPGTSTDGLVYDRYKNQIILGDYSQEKLIVLNDKTLAVQATFATPGHAMTNLSLNSEKQILLTGDDFTQDIGVLNTISGHLRWIKNAPATRDALYDSKTGRIIATTLRRVYWIDPKTGLILQTLKVPSIQIRIALDADRRYLYVSSFSTGELLRVQADTGRIENRLLLEKGVRFLHLTEDGSTLFASGYFKGNIYQIRVPEMVVEEEIYAGPRVRTLHMAPGSNRLVFGSSLGVFRYQMAK